jgi:hypothetical protein
MLWKVLHEVEAARAPLDLNELSRRLDVERSVLDGMVQFWVRKGRLVDDAATAGQAAAACAAHGCGAGCSGAQGCPFTMKMPRTIVLVKPAFD